MGHEPIYTINGCRLGVSLSLMGEIIHTWVVTALKSLHMGNINVVGVAENIYERTYTITHTPLININYKELSVYTDCLNIILRTLRLFVNGVHNLPNDIK